MEHWTSDISKRRGSCVWLLLALPQGGAWMNCRKRHRRHQGAIWRRLTCCQTLRCFLCWLVTCLPLNVYTQWWQVYGVLFYARNNAFIWTINILTYRYHIHSKWPGGQNDISVATFLQTPAKWESELGRGFRSTTEVLSTFGSDLWEKAAM